MPQITHNKPTLGKEEEKAVLQLKSGWIAQGYEVSAFEDEFCNFLGMPTGHAVAVSIGTKEPQKLIESLKKNGIEAIIPLEDWELLDSANKFPNAAELTKTTVSLPLYPSLSDSDINAIISVVKNI